MGKGWIEDLVARLKIPDPVYASGRLTVGQPIKILLDWPEDRAVDGVALGKKDRKGRHKVKYVDRKGRTVTSWQPAKAVIVGYEGGRN